MYTLFFKIITLDEPVVWICIYGVKSMAGLQRQLSARLVTMYFHKLFCEWD